jgi:hypothetical protein
LINKHLCMLLVEASVIFFCSNSSLASNIACSTMAFRASVFCFSSTSLLSSSWAFLRLRCSFDIWSWNLNCVSRLSRASLTLPCFSSEYQSYNLVRDFCRAAGHSLSTHFIKTHISLSYIVYDREQAVEKCKQQHLLHFSKSVQKNLMILGYQ